MSHEAPTAMQCRDTSQTSDPGQTATGPARVRWTRARASWRPGLARRTRGQALVAMALLMPVLLFFGLACIQFAIIFKTYIDVQNVTRDAARWVSVHPQVLDSTNDATIRARLPSGIKTARLTTAYSPQCTTVSGGKCTAAATRNTGDPISVTSTYNITDILFLPSTLGWGSWAISIPTLLPSYTITMQVEPS